MTCGARNDDESDDRGSVVVTGTSTGIGAATVSRLATLGFHVFAGVRRDEDVEAVRRRSNGHVTPLMIDITDAAMIELAELELHAAERRGQAAHGL